MKDSTIVRLRMSKQLFESLADQILAEAKDMSGGVYTEVVKQKKEKKKVEDKKEKVEDKKEKVEEVKDKVEEMETRVAEEGNINEYVGLGPDEVKALEYLAAIMGTGTGAAIASQYGKELKDIAGKVKDFIKSKKSQKADSSVAEVKKKVKLRESEKSEHVIGFQEYDDVLDSFLNWLKWHYKEASTDNVDEWEEDESFYFDKPSLTLTLWNDEFDKKINSEFAEYIEELEDNIEWEEWGDS